MTNLKLAWETQCSSEEKSNEHEKYQNMSCKYT